MTTERLVSAEEAVQVVADYPRIGQVGEGMYVGRQHAGENQEDQLVNLTAVWAGAEKLAEDPSVRCVILERNPNRRDLGAGVVTLTIGQDLPRIGLRSSVIVYRRGVACEGESDLTRTILGNIARELVKP